MESSGIPKISIDDTKYNISYLKLNYLIPIYMETTNFYHQQKCYAV